MAPPRCFQVHPDDNVATLLDDAGPGPCRVIGHSAGEIMLAESVKLGHKIALCDLAVDQPVIKFAVPIGRATTVIGKGRWVHLHNLASQFDQRSQTLDLHTGNATDTQYR